MKHREGDKVQIIDQSSGFFDKKGIVLPIGKYDGFIWVAFPPSKSTGNRFNPEQIKLIRSAIQGKEIEPSGCCVSSSGYISADVLLEECPIKRDIGQHEKFVDMTFKEKVKVCTCTNSHYVSTCENYKGLKEVTRGGRKVWRVSCDAVEV